MAMSRVATVIECSEALERLSKRRTEDARLVERLRLFSVALVGGVTMRWRQSWAFRRRR
jgi:hypothetical protein